MATHAALAATRSPPNCSVLADCGTTFLAGVSSVLTPAWRVGAVRRGAAALVGPTRRVASLVRLGRRQWSWRAALRRDTRFAPPREVTRRATLQRRGGVGSCVLQQLHPQLVEPEP